MSLLALIASTTLALAAGPAAAPCDTPEHRAFDFWIGEWEVWSNDQLAGTNRIEPMLGGCALAEHWRGASGIEGRSVNAWDAAAGRWRQLWVAEQGDVLLLEGGMTESTMRLEGVRPHPTSGGAQRQRIRWTPHADGSVRQLWEASDDDGRSWRVVFDGRYRRVAPHPGR